MAAEGKKRAVLVGCNYLNTQFRLHGCINDVFLMRDLIRTSFGFDAESVTVLTDEPDTSPEKLPTHVNIMAALKKMVNEAEAGDVLFFHFSGHGTVIPSLEPNQPYKEHEAIVPCDLNLITDMDLRYLIKKLKQGTSFTILSDSCHSGGLIDKDKEQIGPSRVSAKGLPPPVHFKSRAISVGSIVSCLQSVSTGLHTVGDIAHTGANIASATANALNTGSNFVGGITGSITSTLSGIFNKDVSIRFQPHSKQKALLFSNKSLTEDEGILLSGCQANETSADLAASELTGGTAHGAFTYALVQVLKQNKGYTLTNKELVMQVRKFLGEQGLEQHSCLYCSEANADAPFLATQNPRGWKKPSHPAEEPPESFPGDKRKRPDSPTNYERRRADDDEAPIDRRKRPNSPTNYERRRADDDEAPIDRRKRPDSSTRQRADERNNNGYAY